MVMNPAAETFSKLLEHRLEPEIYSLPLLRDLIDTISVNPPANGGVIGAKHSVADSKHFPAAA